VVGQAARPARHAPGGVVVMRLAARHTATCRVLAVWRSARQAASSPDRQV
jgi:hypothetical protein